MMCRRILTHLFTVLVATSISADDKPEGEKKEPPRPPAPEKLFERLDADKNQTLSRAEFMRGMSELHRRAQQGGEKPGTDGDGKRPPRPEGEPKHPPGEGDGDGKRPPRPEGAPKHPPGEGDGDGKRPPRPPKEDQGEEGGRPPGGPLESAFGQADADKSGTLTLEEFTAALGSLPHRGRPPGPK